jgi:hypothetical protein
MPTLTVGYTKKIGESNYGSRGANVEVSMDIDGLPTNPDTMKAQIAGLFNMARQAVADELAKTAPTVTTMTTTATPPLLNAAPSTNGHAGNGQPTNGTTYGQTATRVATPNQIKALFGLSKRANINLRQLIGERYSVGRPDDLEIGQASRLIDELK